MYLSALMYHEKGSIFCVTLDTAQKNPTCTKKILEVYVSPLFLKIL